jgi:hypothetical protein
MSFPLAICDVAVQYKCLESISQLSICDASHKSIVYHYQKENCLVEILLPSGARGGAPRQPDSPHFRAHPGITLLHRKLIVPADTAT